MKIIDRVKRAVWDDISTHCPYATFFHTSHWSQIMTDTFDYCDVSKGFIFDDGTMAVFPLMIRKLPFSCGFLKCCVSGPPYTYGGPIADGNLTQDKYDEMLEYISYIYRNDFRIIIRGNPFIDDIAPHGFSEVDDLSHVIELEKIEKEEDFYKIYSKRYRSYIRKAINNRHLSFRESKSDQDYKTLYQIYQKSKPYWNADITKYPSLLFKNIFKLKNSSVKLWAVYYKDKMIGGDINLYWANKCHMWLSYHDREYAKLHHRRYLLHNLFLHSKQNHITHYDLMQSGGISSQMAFKESMGASAHYFKAVVKDNVFRVMAKKLYNTIKLSNN